MRGEKAISEGRDDSYQGERFGGGEKRGRQEQKRRRIDEKWTRARGRRMFILEDSG